MSYFKAQLGGRSEDDGAADPRRPAHAPSAPPPNAVGNTRSADAPKAFGNALGGRPDLAGAAPGAEATNSAAPPPSVSPAGWSAQTGPRPQQPAPDAAVPPATRMAEPTACPLCRGALAAAAGIWGCVGRCGSRWVRDGGHLVALTALPYGVCGCCAERQALARVAEGRLICPLSGRHHLMQQDGAAVPIELLDVGACLCCAPPQPLVLAAGRVVCPARADRAYVFEDGRWNPAPSKATPAETLAAIDAALRANTAKVTIYGLFDLEG